MKSRVPESRVRAVNEAPVRREGGFVLYWMIAGRRLGWNFAFERAVEWASFLAKPLVVLEALRCDYRWASDRLHRFVIEGMAENARRLDGSGVRYHPYVERAPGEGKGLLTALAARAAVVVTDDYPSFFLPSMVAAAGRALARVPSPSAHGVRLEAVDANGLLPVAAADRVFTSAYHFRRFLQKTLPEHLPAMPRANPLARRALVSGARLPGEIARRWPAATARELAAPDRWLHRLPIDHQVGAAPLRGGSDAAAGRLERFIEQGLPRYAADRNHPDLEAASGLSPWLHFGHVGAHQIFAAVARREDWSPGRLSRAADGKREGWWGMSAGAEAFLDQLVTWRELGFNRGAGEHGGGYHSLPRWARRTLEAHAADPRPDVYSFAQFDEARTHDRLWNAAQNELRREGRMHNYLRMLWGKKILEWSPSPRSALDTMIRLNDRYAVDGRDPNSYSGIHWIMGRYDRPWAPERAIFGQVRYMSSQNTARKVRLRKYLERLG